MVALNSSRNDGSECIIREISSDGRVRFVERGLLQERYTTIERLKAAGLQDIVRGRHFKIVANDSESREPATVTSALDEMEFEQLLEHGRQAVAQEEALKDIALRYIENPDIVIIQLDRLGDMEKAIVLAMAVNELVERCVADPVSILKRLPKYGAAIETAVMRKVEERGAQAAAEEPIPLAATVAPEGGKEAGRQPYVLERAGRFARKMAGTLFGTGL